MLTSNRPRGRVRFLQWLLAGLMIVIGLAIGIPGIKLVTLGGSAYFLVMGAVMLIAAVLIIRTRSSGILLYALAFIASIIWAISDAGWEFWPLFSRLFTFGVLAFLAAILWPFLRAAQTAQPVNKKPAFGVAAVLALVLLVSAGWMFKPQTLVSASEDVPVQPVAPGEQQKDWKHWGNTTHGDRFAALDQINKQNVNNLKVAWVAHTGDIPQSNGSGAEDQNTPLQIGDTLFVCTPYSKVLALDVDTGKEKWRYDSKATAPNWQRCRGLGYYEETQAQSVPAQSPQVAACPRRLFLPTTDARLVAINADNGKLCDDFGDPSPQGEGTPAFSLSHWERAGVRGNSHYQNVSQLSLFAIAGRVVASGATGAAFSTRVGAAFCRRNAPTAWVRRAACSSSDAAAAEASSTSEAFCWVTLSISVIA